MMKNLNLKWTLIIFTLLVTGLPHFRRYLGNIWGVSLSGVTIKVHSPRFNTGTFLSGKYQSDLEEYFADRFGYKELLVKYENTLNLKLFNETSTAMMSNPVILGNDHYLFEKSYINNYNGVNEIKRDRPYPAPQSIDETARRLGNAAKAFQNLGIDFVVFFYPHKAWIYPELLKDKWKLDSGHTKAIEGYKNLLTALKKYDVPVSDGVEVFQNLRKTQPDLPLYPRGGTHWQFVAACHGLNNILDVARKRSKRELPPIECKPGKIRINRDREMDIATLLNVFDEAQFFDPLPELNARIPAGSLNRPLKFLLEGTSFSNDINNTLKATGYGSIDSPPTVEYYRHSAYDFSQVMNKDLVIFEQSQASFISINTMEFLDDLEAQSKVFRDQLPTN